jgi:hypothetical protein
MRILSSLTAALTQLCADSHPRCLAVLPGSKAELPTLLESGVRYGKLEIGKLKIIEKKKGIPDSN